jgi:DNA-binding protein Fis
MPATTVFPPELRHVMERDAFVLEALAQAGNNKSRAARTLGLTRAQLRSRLEKHGLGT